MMGKGWLGVQSKAKELADVKASNKMAIADFDGLTANQIQSNLSKMKSQNGNLEALLSDTDAITPLLVEVVDTIPQEMWINKFNYTEPFPSKGPGSRNISIEGAIKTGKDGRADLALGNQFKDALIKLPNFKKICGDSATIQYVNVAGAGNANAAAASGRPNADQETSFVFTCGKTGGR